MKFNIIIRSLVAVATVSLLLALYVAFSATRDCDLADVVLILALPGFVISLVCFGLLMNRVPFSVRSLNWILVFTLFMGFAYVGYQRSYLNRVAVGDCQ